MVAEAGDLKVTVEQPASWARRLTITVPAGRVERERRSATQRFARQLKLPGFRKGKIPPHVLEKRFGAAIQQQAIERVVGEAYREALEQEGILPIAHGQVDQIDYANGTDLTFQVDIEVRPDIQLDRIGGFTLKRPAVEVSDADVDRVMERLREQQALWSTVQDEPPQADDRAVVEISRFEDGSEGEPRRYEVVLGSGQVAPSIEEAVLTLAPGADAEFDIELPAEPNDPNSAIEQHHVRIRLLEAKRPELPDLDDEFAKALGDFEDLADLRSKVLADLEREAGQEADASVRQMLMKNIIDANPFEVPHSMTAQYLSSLVPDREGVPPEELERIREAARPHAELTIKQALVVQRVAALESLDASAADVDARVSTIADRVERPVAAVRAQLERANRIKEIEDEITENNVFEYLKSLSTIEQG